MVGLSGEELVTGMGGSQPHHNAADIPPCSSPQYSSVRRARDWQRRHPLHNAPLERCSETVSYETNVAVSGTALEQRADFDMGSILVNAALDTFVIF